MTKIRICFSKSGALRYIGHLDFLKVFQQTIRRAGLPVAYSQGFNPHMQMSFALPLPLGMTSHKDYADLTLLSDIPENIASKLNSHAPEGLNIQTIWETQGPGAAAIVTAADYCLPIANPEIDSILSQQSIIVPKKTKSGIKDTDIRPDILNIWELEGATVEDSGEKKPLVIMRLSAGSARFINPLLVAGLLLKHDAESTAITRVDLYRQSDEKGLVSLYEAPPHR